METAIFAGCIAAAGALRADHYRDGMPDPVDILDYAMMLYREALRRQWRENETIAWEKRRRDEERVQP